jgi:LytR cell envelope-related transcriptional attenuator
VARATTMTASVVHAPRTVTVLVANASGVNGAAAKRATTLTTAGYHVLTPTNTAPTPTTSVLFTSDFETDARAIAMALGIPQGNVRAVPTTPPVPNASKANVLVIIGRDARAT